MQTTNGVTIIQAGLRAITTRYVCGKIIARSGKLVVAISYPHELNDDGRHEAAARALCAKAGWQGVLAGSTLEDSQGRGGSRVFIWIDQEAAEALAKAF